MRLKTPDQFVYFIDIDNDINWKNIIKVELPNIPENYLPLPESFYEKGDFEPYGENLRTQINDQFSQNKKLYKTQKGTINLAAEPPAPNYKKNK